MATITRHVGKLKNTGIRAVVVFRKLPEDANSCLVVESDRLPDMYHDNLMKIVNSREAQDTTELYDVLNRRKFADGGNALQTLHYKGFLRKVSVADVELYPLPNHPLPLSMANDEIDGNVEGVNEKVDTVQETAPIPTHTEGQVPPAQQIDPSDSKGIAKSLMAQAKILEEEAKTKKEKAYTLDPTLRPKRGRPKMSAEDKAKAEKERLEKQRKRTAENRAKKKAEKAKKDD